MLIERLKDYAAGWLAGCTAECCCRAQVGWMQSQVDLGRRQREAPDAGFGAAVPAVIGCVRR